MPHHDSNLGTFLSWGMDLSAVYVFFLVSYRVVGGTYSGPSAAAWKALDPCGDCYAKLLAFLLQNLDTFQMMFLFAFFRFLTLWLLLEVMKMMVRILYALYCVRRRNRLVGDKKEYTHPLELDSTAERQLLTQMTATFLYSHLEPFSASWGLLHAV
ncbi:hypothetical protein MYU51_000669 [Penicillium brevicompactum]